VLGMGVPTTANYCIMASTCAPILMSEAIGVPELAAHFFVFYFGIVADITPPVALAAYAGAAIAKAKPMLTALNATRLAIAAFIVPYIFALNPAMLFLSPDGALWGAETFEVIQTIGSALLGLFGISAGLTGHLFRPMSPLIRATMLVGGLCMMIPGSITDLIGLVLVIGAIFYQRTAFKRLNTL